MIRNKSYAGLDYFRIIAALLIIAIHTSPLLSYSKMADFVLTSIIARIAVPFFFML
ncbi:TPA: acyltransferase family protein, partial [Clostridioides difficile]